MAGGSAAAGGGGEGGGGRGRYGWGAAGKTPAPARRPARSPGGAGRGTKHTAFATSEGAGAGRRAGRSRAMHKSQGFGNFEGGGGGPRTESFHLLEGEPATKDIFDGVDNTWGRVPGGAEVGWKADAIIAQFNPKDPAASVPALMAM